MCSGKSTGLRSKCASALNTVGSKSTLVTKINEAAARAGERNQETSSNTSIATGVRLRRRLSKIFHRDKAEIGLRAYRPDRLRTQGSSQAAICQSPRIQRCLRATSPAYREGCSSYSVTSLSNAERE